MTERGLWLDGNGVAGLLTAVFGSEMTTSVRDCPGCSTSSTVGALRAYQGAGTVLRCPGCGEAAMRIAVLPDRYVVSFTGTWRVELIQR